MRANEFINEDAIGTSPKRPRREGSRHSRGHEPQARYTEVAVNEEDVTEEKKSTTAICKSSKTNDQLGASMLSKCKSLGLRAREGNKSHLVNGKRIKVGGKKIKGKVHGGPLPDWGEHK